MLCFKSLAISNFSHDLSFDLSTYDPFHQLLKEVKPLALHFDLNPDLGRNMPKILGRAMCLESTFDGTPTQSFKVYGLNMTFGRYAKNPWQSNVFGKYIQWNPNSML